MGTAEFEDVKLFGPSRNVVICHRDQEKSKFIEVLVNQLKSVRRLIQDRMKENWNVPISFLIFSLCSTGFGLRELLLPLKDVNT